MTPSALKLLALVAIWAAALGNSSPAQTNGPLSPGLFPLGGGRSQPAFAPPRPEWNQARRIGLRLPTFTLTSNIVVAGVETGADIPSRIAVLIKRPDLAQAPPPQMPRPGSDPTKFKEEYDAYDRAMKAQRSQEKADWRTAQWMPWTNSLRLDLGPGDGRRTLRIGALWGTTEGEPHYTSSTDVEVDHAPPLVVITNPTARVTSRPLIQLQGYSVKPLTSIRYDLRNAVGHSENQQGFVNKQMVDLSAVGLLSTNFFTCYDIELAPGTNTIVLRCEDHFGNTATNVLIYVFALEGDHMPPVIVLDRPLPGRELTGDRFTARGRLDDPTAQIVGVVVAENRTNTLKGLVERNGYFWLEDVPLLPGENRLTLTATDAAGNSSSTNLVFSRGESELVIDIGKIPPEHLWHRTVTVTGSVRPANQDVWVNGAQATVGPDGRWTATNVPVLSPNGGTAVFDATAVPRAASAQPSATPEDRARTSVPIALVGVRSHLSTNALTLNATRPACSQFKLHLSGTAGRGFILMSSTNLLAWSPILTNLNSQATFIYEDTDTAGHPCQFFRVVPLD